MGHGFSAMERWFRHRYVSGPSRGPIDSRKSMSVVNYRFSH